MEKKRSLETTDSDEEIQSATKKLTLENREEKRSVRLPEGSRLADRLLSALESGVWADCKFLVGENKEEVKACKMILSLASPVFSAMFFGGVPETGPVLVPDIEPEAFNKLLEFIYVHEIQINSLEEALEVMMAADKYMLPDLIDICSDFCVQSSKEKEVSMRVLCDMFEIASLLNLEELQTAAIRKAQEVAAALFSSAEFLTLSADSLVSILRRGHLNIDSELQLINAALGWASNRCDQRDISIEGKALRSVLEEVGAFKHLRFLSLTPRELRRFESDPYKRGVLTAGEMEAIRKYHDSNNDEPPPDSICNLSKPRDNSIGGRVLHVREGKFLKTFTSPGSVTEKYTLNTRIDSLLGVTILTQINEAEYDSHYMEDLTVNVWNGAGRKYAYGYYQGLAEYGNEITVPLERLRNIFPLQSGETVTIRIRFGESGKYPVFKLLDTDEKFSDNIGHVIKLKYK